jgi:hypothetical protein
MAFFWDRHVSSGIRELGYDVGTETLAVVFPGRRTVYHRPVPYTVYASIFHARFPERALPGNRGEDCPGCQRSPEGILTADGVTVHQGSL